MVAVIVLIVFGAIFPMNIAEQVRKYACHREELNLKRELLDRGMAIDEIERVLAAGRDPPLDE